MAGCLLLYVKLMTGETVAVEVDQQATVGDLRRHVRERFGPVVLTWQGRPLGADCTALSDIGVCPESVLHEVQRRHWDVVRDGVSVEGGTGVVTGSMRFTSIGLLCTTPISMDDQATVRVVCGRKTHVQQLSSGVYRMGLMRQSAFVANKRPDNDGHNASCVVDIGVGTIHNQFELVSSATWGDCVQFEACMAVKRDAGGAIVVDLTWKRFGGDGQLLPETTSSTVTVPTGLDVWPDSVCAYAFVNAEGDSAVIK
eukprot:TRINITY_DN3149_c0_g1_i3.p1 TRINITY_DN3149_c0_g1~~TRINITY_DN3149_c0_g1_i3.p1  ORF type:complete len:279 (+),score=73.68 TRINITY_DN3149_c0_g1_i3:73-837(+)